MRTFSEPDSSVIQENIFLLLLCLSLFLTNFLVQIKIRFLWEDIYEMRKSGGPTYFICLLCLSVDWCCFILISYAVNVGETEKCIRQKVSYLTKHFLWWYTSGISQGDILEYLLFYILGPLFSGEIVKFLWFLLFGKIEVSAASK